MVHLTRVDGTFAANVLAARLGAEGIVWELRGASSVYPMGRVEVLVDEEDVERARELLLLDAVEAVFDDDGSV
jgi:Putative prokaryotic signal transducing protein